MQGIFRKVHPKWHNVLESKCWISLCLTYIHRRQIYPSLAQVPQETDLEPKTVCAIISLGNEIPNSLIRKKISNFIRDGRKERWASYVSVILAYANWGMASAMEIVRAFQLYIGEIACDDGQTGRKQEGTSCVIRGGVVEKIRSS